MAEIPSELQAEVEKLERKHIENPAGRYFVPLANAYRKLGELELAEARLREGLRKHPEYLSAHIVLGRVLADRGAGVEAAEEFRYVLSVDPQNLIALRTLGELAMAEGRTEEAGRWYRELLGVDPMNDEARQALSELDSRAVEVAGEEEFEDGGWWTSPEPESSAGEPTLEGVAHDSMGDWAGPAATLEAAPPAPEAGQPYSGEMNGEFLIGGESGAEALAEVDAGYAAESFEDDDAEFVTETIAELYARQGFYDRAADVYRELIRQRGAEPGLDRRLAEIERMAAGLPPLGEDAGEVAPLEDAPIEPLPALEGFDFDDVGGGAVLDAAWGEEVSEVVSAEPLVELVVDEPEVEPLAVLELAESDDVLEPAPDAEDAFAASFSGGFLGFGELVSAELASTAEVELTSSEDIAPDPAPAADGATVAFVLGELLAWRAPVQSAAADPEPDIVAQAETEAPDTVLAEPASFSFDEYFGAAAASEPVEETPASPVMEPVPTFSASIPAAADEEEDLESFQAWLRSLKR